jgi:ketosteroid isomerase-like protein
MSQENVELVRQAHERFAKTGEPMWEVIGGQVEVFDHDIPDASNPYRGVDGMVKWLADFAQSWERYEMEVERVVDAGERVVSLFRIRAVGAGSGVPVERGDAIVWTLQAGKLVRLDYFNDQQQALESVGLAEQTD